MCSPISLPDCAQINLILCSGEDPHAITWVNMSKAVLKICQIHTKKANKSYLSYTNLLKRKFDLIFQKDQTQYKLDPCTEKSKAPKDRDMDSYLYQKNWLKKNNNKEKKKTSTFFHKLHLQFETIPFSICIVPIHLQHEKCLFPIMHHLQ